MLQPARHENMDDQQAALQIFFRPFQLLRVLQQESFVRDVVPGTDGA